MQPAPHPPLKQPSQGAAFLFSMMWKKDVAMRILMRILTTMILTKKENRRTLVSAKIKGKWNRPHRGMTWRDMPVSSETSTTAKKLHFALFRAGALVHEELHWVNVRRAAMNLEPIAY
jgi:hypothetical protein